MATVTPRKDSARFAWTALGLVVTTIALALVDGFGNGAGWWTYAAAKDGLYLLAAVAVVAVLLGTWARFGRGKGGELVAVAAILLGVAFVTYLFQLERQAEHAPAIHDVTTNIADPPAFHVLVLRPDNLADIPDLGRPGWAQLSALERWRAVHEDSYGDLAAIRFSVAPSTAIAAAAGLARQKGWAIAGENEGQGWLDATATTPWFHFKDDIAIRAAVAPGGGTLLDMRSVRRTGQSDFGRGAHRIRDFLHDLAQRIPVAR